MKLLRLLPVVLFSVAMTSWFSGAAYANPTVFANVEVVLANTKLQKKSAGIRTLFISLYDEASQGPMPFASIKVELKGDAKGTIYKGTLDSSNVMIMRGDASPKSFRIKARLDKDGSAGPDEPGDLVGQVTGVKAGSKVTIKIDKAL